MEDFILSHQPNWRYCKVRDGEKVPFPANWQNKPLLLEQVDSRNIGLILGPKGNGICAIDFDGTSAWTWAEHHGIDRTIFNSVAWTSNKVDRCQIAFEVPEHHWHILKTKKIVTKAPSYPGAKDGEGFEFRWAGGQSVLPPSIHPDTKGPYEWIIDATNEVQVIPDCVLNAWYDVIAQDAPKKEDLTPEVNLDELTDNDVVEVDQALEMLKAKYPALTYDDWFRISSAVAHQLGRSAAKILMMKHYPERRRGEYDDLYASWNKAKSPTIGSLMFMAGVKKTQSNTGIDAVKSFMKEQNRFRGLI